jgi:hypothetical protein
VSDEPKDLGYLARQLQQLIDELGTMHDDVAALMAIVMRIDGTMTGVVRDIRALNAQLSLLAGRVTSVEQAP